MGTACQFELKTFVDLFVSSCSVHCRKPDKDMIALDIPQAQADQMIYTDDQEMFVEVAPELGISGILHTGYGATRKALEEFGLALSDQVLFIF